MANTPQARKRIRRNDRRRTEVNGAPRQPHPHLSSRKVESAIAAWRQRLKQPQRWQPRSLNWRAVYAKGVSCTKIWLRASLAASPSAVGGSRLKRH
jgi:hypothetical protein